jgi:hypothetical protein
VKLSFPKIATVIILSLATWSLVYTFFGKLDEPETAIVVGGWAVVVFMADWMRLTRRGRKGSGVEKP